MNSSDLFLGEFTTLLQMPPELQQQKPAISKQLRQFLGEFPLLKLSIILILTVGIPFVLKFKGPRTELYPAVLLPAGASLDIYTNFGYEHEHPVFWGLDIVTEQWRPLSPRQLFAPLSPAHSYTFYQKLPHFDQPSWRWLNQQLYGLGCSGNTLILRWQRSYLTQSSSDTILYDIVHEDTISTY